MGITQRSKQFFQQETNSASKKCWVKKSSEKNAKNFFLYSHEYRDQKMGGKNARNNFSRNTLIVRAKNVGKKIVAKSAKNRFLYSHEYRDQKRGERTRETIFPETHQ